MPELDRDAKIFRNSSQEIDERRQLTRLKVGSHLYEHGAELVAELAHSLEEDLGGTSDIAQPLLVRDLLRQLESEDKSSRRPLEPAAYCRLSR